MPVNHAKKFLKFVHTEALFSELFSWTSNCSHCLSFANFLPKFGIVTPEDILLPNMSVCGWISITGLALICTYRKLQLQFGQLVHKMEKSCLKYTRLFFRTLAHYVFFVFVVGAYHWNLSKYLSFIIRPNNIFHIPLFLNKMTLIFGVFQNLNILV